MGPARKTRILTLCAVLVAVIAALNFLASLHLLRLDAVFYLIGGAFVFYPSMRFGAGPGAAVYAAAAALSFIIVPDKIWLMFFIGVFGPIAVIQAFADKRAGGKVSAAVTIALCFVLFYLFSAFVITGDGVAQMMGLPGMLALPGAFLITGFAVVSAVIAFLVNRGLCAFLSRRLGGFGPGAAQSGRAYEKTDEKAENPGQIILPKLEIDEE